MKRIVARTSTATSISSSASRLLSSFATYRAVRGTGATSSASNVPCSASAAKERPLATMPAKRNVTHSTPGSSGFTSPVARSNANE